MRFRATLLADVNRYLALAGKASTIWLLPGMLNPRVLPVTFIRVGQKLASWGLGPLASIWAWLTVLVFKVEVPPHADIGPGLVLPHPMGLVLGSARIGANVTIFQNVTLGARTFEPRYDLATRPTLEDGCVIGAGAVVLGPVTVHAGAVVPANSLITRDVFAKQKDDDDS